MKQGLIVFLIAIQFIWSANRFLYAQEPAVRGLIMEKSGVSKLSNVFILNKRTKFISQSDEYGLFRMPALRGELEVRASLRMGISRKSPRHIQ